MVVFGHSARSNLLVVAPQVRPPLRASIQSLSKSPHLTDPQLATTAFEPLPYTKHVGGPIRPPIRPIDPFNLGDYNSDGIVNAADYTVYRNRKAGIGGTSLPEGSDDTPQNVDVDDCQRWKDLYAYWHGGGASTNGNKVPESSSIALWMCGILLVFRARRRA